MKNAFQFLIVLCLPLIGFSQATPKNDTWGVYPTASDDRFSNPKSKLYAGPDGWYNYGEVRSTLAGTKINYNYKGSLVLINDFFVLVDQKKLLTVYMNFETETPAVGVYQLADKGNPAQKKVSLSFSDVSGQKIREWKGGANSGTLTLTKVNGYLYFKARNLKLEPTSNFTGEGKNMLMLGLEGAIAP